MLSRTWLVPTPPQPRATIIRRPRRRQLITGSRVLASVLAAAGCLLGASLLLVLTRGNHVGVAAAALPSPSYPPSAFSGYRSFAPNPVESSSSPALPVSRVSVQPVGPCQAGCPAVIPHPSPQFSGNSEADGGTWLEQTGYLPLEGGPQWGNTWNDLNVIVARKFGSAHGGLRAFFFDSGVLIGWDVPDGDGSTSIKAFRLADNEIDIRYQLHGGSASFADVRFQSTTNSLIRMDPLPPASLRD
jgi:hypothetical protein